MKLKYTILIAATLIFSACSDKKEEASKKSEPLVKAGKIEITSNDHAYKKKVEEIENKDDRSYYYSYNKNTQKEKRTNLDANMRIRSPYEKVQVSLLVSGLSKDFIVKCSACHNDYANGVIGPSLLKKDEKFIYDTIMAFKTGEKTNVLMTELVQQLDNKHIKKLALEIATFNKKIDELKGQ